MNKFISIDVYWHNRLTALVSVPFLVTQTYGYSDIVKDYISYSIKMRQSDHSLKNYILKIE